MKASRAQQLPPEGTKTRALEAEALLSDQAVAAGVSQLSEVLVLEGDGRHHAGSHGGGDAGGTALPGKHALSETSPGSNGAGMPERLVLDLEAFQWPAAES